MAGTTRYGNINWAICLSDSIDEALQEWDGVDNDSPAGNKVFLFSNSMTYKIDDNDKVKYLPNLQSFVIKLGKGKQTVSISGGLIPTKLVSDVNKISLYINTWRKNTADPIYFWARGKELDTSWDALKFMNSSGNMVDYFRCRLKTTSFKLEWNGFEFSLNAEEVSS